jgi:predicted esterase
VRPAITLTLALVVAGCGGGSPFARTPRPADDHRASLRSTLAGLANAAADPLVRQHFRSMIEVIASGDRGSATDSAFIAQIWEAFQDGSAPFSPRLTASYATRSRPLVVAWVSPTDSQVSFAWLTVPAQWDPAREYPLYVLLHGLWQPAEDRLSYLAFPYSQPGGASFAFEDGYLLAPWGRGNRWYQDIAEVDIAEAVTATKRLVRVDPTRSYLSGHSMGGYGAWRIVRRSPPGTWAALGVHAGALNHDSSETTAEAVRVLRDVPTYFVVGAADRFLEVNQVAYGLLREAGNSELSFVTFPGGHDYRQQDVEQMYLWLRQFDIHGRRAR